MYYHDQRKYGEKCDFDEAFTQHILKKSTFVRLNKRV